MPFTIHRADGTDELLSGELGTASTTAVTNIYDEDGTSILASRNIGGSQYFVQNGLSWQDKLHSPNDTLIASNGNDFLVWDSATTSGVTFTGTNRARLQTTNASRLLQIVDTGAGDDVVNFSHRNNTGTPGAYAVDITVYGGSGSDLIAGGSGDDLMVGGTQTDSLFGGQGSDTFVAETDALANDGDFTVALDGEGGRVTIALSGGDRVVRDYFDGGTTFDFDTFADLDTDTLQMQMPAGAPGSRNVLTLAPQGTVQQQIFGIEVIIATAGADLINLTAASGMFNLAEYEQNVTVQAGDGADIVFSGRGNDVIIGDALGGENGYSDTLFGGGGDDTIYGDSDGNDLGAADTIFGGFNEDTVFGGAGNDVLIDDDDGSFYGGMGDDTLAIHFRHANSGRADGGFAEDPESEPINDGDDRIFVTGVYNLVEAELGSGNDAYISFADENQPEIGSGARMDSVYGGSGNDLISSWYGDDTVFGGSGDDVLWTGADNDYAAGGAGMDLIYVQGGTDFAYGGEGHDYFYVMMGESGVADIYDEAREGLAASSSNKLILAGRFAFDGTDADGMLDGYGLYDLNHDLELDVVDEEGFSIEPLHLSRVEGEEFLWQIDSGFYGSTVYFDQRDIDGIALVNNDAAPGAPGVEYYLWSEEAQTYVYTP